MVKQFRKKDPFAEREAERYENPIPSREYILDLLEEIARPTTQRQIEKTLEIRTKEQKEALYRRLTAMVRDGQLLQNRRGAYGLIDKMELIKGHVIGHKDGYGFVVPEKGGGDLFLNPKQMRMVFPEDEVLVRPGGKDYRGKQEGFIVEVIERHTHELVGRFMEESGICFVQPSNQRITQTILIPPGKQKNTKNGQMVVVKITEQPSLTTQPLGQVVEILGDHMGPGMEIDIAIRNHDLPVEWPTSVLKEAKRFDTQVPQAALDKRIDLRQQPFVTIDGEDAKDFDDAVYCEKTRTGWKLYVAIADVSHYVLPGSALDQEAFIRGNSVYFPERVIPMLPEVLSNELCSLKPQVDRLTLVCEMTINEKGTIQRYRFLEAVICSHARMTYTQVNEILVHHNENLKKQYAHLIAPLETLYDVYKILKHARQKRGAIDFELPETKIIFGENRKIERIVALNRNDAHKLIEECMLCANICAAKFLLKHECPGLYRIHEGPSSEKLNDLNLFLSELGLSFTRSDDPRPRDYAKLLVTIQNRPDAHLIQTILLRSLSQAIYSPTNIGHFGLAFDAYTHFTSPIRRYPDLLVHRSIRHILQNKHERLRESVHQFEKWGEHCSMTERRADEATREAIDWLKCEYMLDKLGEEFDGIITGITNFGFFVELKDIYVEGLVHISTLKNDYYHFDSIQHVLKGERTKKCYRLGDPVHVKVVRVDLDQREMDFIVTDMLLDKTPRKKKNKKSRL